MDHAHVDDKLFGALLDEIKETLDKFEQVCLRLEGKAAAEDLKLAFRYAHNIKGAAHVYQLVELGNFVHSIEDLLKVIKDQGVAVTPDTVDVLLRSHSATADWVQGLRSDRKFIPECSKLHSQLSACTKALKTAPTLGAPPAECAQQTPPAARAAKGAPDTQPGEGKPPSPPSDSAAKGIKKQRNRPRPSGTLRIQSSKVDEIMQIVGELSIHQSILWHGYNSNTLDSVTCSNSLGINQKALKDLQDLILNLRMQPLKSLFQRVERSARDLARELNKELEVSFTGEDVFLDKTVIEMMVDPMTHLVRNSIDHGVENLDRRKNSGKPPKARLRIGAYQDVGQVIITVSDDGQGIDEDVIKKKAVEKNLLPPGSELSREEILNLIFLPGFSTKDSVTAISGRGVGMDVVKDAVNQLSGTIDIFTIKGKGTSFKITLPTTLEIIDGLVIKEGSSSYVVPVQDVSEVIDLNSYKVERLGDGGTAIQHRNTPIPVENLSDYLINNNVAVTRGTAASASSKNVALVINLPDNTKMAMTIDGMVAKQQIVVRPLSDQLSDIPGFIGVTVLGNGEPAMILSMSFIGESYMKWVTKAGRAS